MARRFWSKLLHLQGPKKTAAPSPRRSRCVPLLERLEDRLAPAALTFTVNTTLDELTPGDGKLSLREAITRANNHTGPDTIILPAGAFRMTIAGAGDDANLSGDF